jgi:hypothetical protein
LHTPSIFLNIGRSATSSARNAKPFGKRLLGEYQAGLAVREDRAVVHDRDRIGVSGRQIQIVKHDRHGDAGACDRTRGVQQAKVMTRVEIGGELVE